MTLKALLTFLVTFLLTLVRLSKRNPPSKSQLLVLHCNSITQNEAIYLFSLHTKSGLLSAVVSVSQIKITKDYPYL